MRHRRLLWLALVVLLSLTRPVEAQLYVAGSEPWFAEIQDIKISGFYGVTVANEGTTGTTDGLLACFQAGAAITCPVGSDLDVLGPVQSGGGTTGLATIATHGAIGACTFDGATTSGHYVQPSPTVAGQCHDAGLRYPSNGGRILGIVTTTNGSGGLYGVFMYGRGVRAPEAGGTTVWGAVTADVTHAQSSTTLANVTGLAFVACRTATEVWEVDVNLILSQTGTTADWKWGWSIPAGAIVWGANSADPTVDHWGRVAAGTTPLVALTEADTLVTGSANGVHLLAFKAMVFCSSASVMIVQLQFAQNTSDASDNVVKRGSMLIARQVIN